MFFILTVNEYVSCNCEMKLVYYSLMFSQLQFKSTNWGSKWERIWKLKKNRTIWMMTNSRYIAYTEPFFKRLHLLNVKDIFDVHCLKFYYEFANNTPSNYLRDMFKHNYELYHIEARNMIGSTNIQLTPIVFVMFYNTLYRNYWANTPNIRWAELWRIVYTHTHTHTHIYIYIYILPN